MHSKNVYTAIGNLGKKPELKFAPNGTPYARFSVACNYSYKRDGDIVQGCDWIPFVAYGKLAEIASKHLDAGSHVSVDGKLKPWKSTSGDTTRYGVDVVVTDILFLDPKQAAAPEEVAQAAAPDGCVSLAGLAAAAYPRSRPQSWELPKAYAWSALLFADLLFADVDLFFVTGDVAPSETWNFRAALGKASSVDTAPICLRLLTSGSTSSPTKEQKTKLRHTPTYHVVRCSICRRRYFVHPGFSNFDLMGFGLTMDTPPSEGPSLLKISP